MGDILIDNYAIFLGLYTALTRTRGSSRVVYQKILEAQKQYYMNLTDKNLSELETKTLEVLDEAMHKFYLAGYSLEQLWGVHHYLKVADHGMPNQYDENLTSQQNEIVFMLSSLLDQALYSWRSFLDFYLKYLVLFLTGDYIVTMSTSDFDKKLQSYIKQNPNDKKAKNVEEYIRSKVLELTFGGDKEKWGDLLRSLRDKTTHQKLIKPTIMKNQNQEGFEISWPMIRQQTYPELVQWEFENNAFEMLQELFPILYEFDWKPGPFKERLSEKVCK